MVFYINRKVNLKGQFGKIQGEIKGTANTNTIVQKESLKRKKRKKKVEKYKKTEENRLDRLAEARETLTEEDQKQKDKHGPARAGENSGAGAGEGGSRAGRTARAGDACVH